jgi:hypothetical protein
MIGQTSFGDTFFRPINDESYQEQKQFFFRRRWYGLSMTCHFIGASALNIGPYTRPEC